MAEPTKTNQRQDTHLGNWRTSPHNQWAFHHVRELLPTANIACQRQLEPEPSSTQNVLTHLSIDGQSLESHLTANHTDSIVVYRQGCLIGQWHANHCDPTQPHLIFSISKSLTGLITGVLVEQKLLDLSKPLTHYLPGTAGSAFGDCTARHLLDMSVAMDFEENYLEPSGDYFQYRNATAWNPTDQTADNLSLEPFLYTIKPSSAPHGNRFDYRSPTTDMLGILLERVTGVPLATLYSDLLWKPMGAASDAYVTVDAALMARAAGGLCVTAFDLAKVGELVLNGGAAHDAEGEIKQVIPESWIHDTLTAGDREAWLNSDFVTLFPKGRYRNCWYQTGNEDQCFAGVGIHGQWLYVNPTTQIVIAKLSSQPEPLADKHDMANIALLQTITHAVV